MKYGNHTYRAEYDDYVTEAGNIKIGKEKLEKSIALQSELATLTVSVTFSGQYKIE